MQQANLFSKFVVMEVIGTVEEEIKAFLERCVITPSALGGFFWHWLLAVVMLYTLLNCFSTLKKRSSLAEWQLCVHVSTDPGQLQSHYETQQKQLNRNCTFSIFYKRLFKHPQMSICGTAGVEFVYRYSQYVCTSCSHTLCKDKQWTSQPLGYKKYSIPN